MRVIIGNEVILRGDVPVEQMTEYLDRAREPLATFSIEAVGERRPPKGPMRDEEIAAIDGVSVFDANEISGLIDRAAGREIALTLRAKDGGSRTVKLTPKTGPELPTLGIGAETTPPTIGTAPMPARSAIATASRRPCSAASAARCLRTWPSRMME